MIQGQTYTQKSSNPSKNLLGQFLFLQSEESFTEKKVF